MAGAERAPAAAPAHAQASAPASAPVHATASAPAHAPASAPAHAPINPARGEIALVIDGCPRRLRLTLGTLAELEAELSVPSLVALAERFESGRVSARDILALLAAGLRGAGEPVEPAHLAAAEIEGGPLAAARAGLALMAAAFGSADAAAAP
ncbi:hypothetical protein LNKW23_04460 [Paralimibaculum aggregatum]|uniref:Gene transfer agent family protein n=2 Tax=Paralimibaculum aggregatum TaxID=3036245 RepID=A0ABQ6LGP6_9RHOB|nr:hypothetical protein LNKW23_04460 [Limibaculum sp. NKW23]